MKALLNPTLMFSLYITGIILLVTLPLNNTVKSVSDVTVLEIRGDYVFHFLLFMPWGILGWWMKRPVWIWLLSGLAFATFTEMLQMAIPWRGYNVNDLLANNIGIILGVLMARGLRFVNS